MSKKMDIKPTFPEENFYENILNLSKNLGRDRIWNSEKQNNQGSEISLE